VQDVAPERVVREREGVAIVRAMFFQAELIVGESLRVRATENRRRKKSTW
jgi:hypothetical protein